MNNHVLIIAIALSWIGNMNPVLAQPTQQPKRIEDMIRTFEEDRNAYARFYSADGSPAAYKRFEALYSDWLSQLRDIPFESLTFEEQIDWILFSNHLNRELDHLKEDARRDGEMSTLIPFSNELTALEDNRRMFVDLQPESTAAQLNRIRRQVTALHKQLESEAGGKKSNVKPTVANRAARRIRSIRSTLSGWYGYYDGYDPTATWWLEQPWKSLDQTLESYAAFLEETLAGVKDSTMIIGDPIGREALLKELHYEMIPYSPEKLVAIANKEFAWCEGNEARIERAWIRRRLESGPRAC